jgi:xylulokinase
MHGAVFLDKDHQVIRPAILWNDQRTAAECDEIHHRAGGRAKLIEMVANPALTGFTAPKILWLRNHEPQHFERLSKVLLPKDDIRRRLTGEFATEVSDASGMLLLDVKNRRWSDELLNKLELEASLLAPVFESCEVTGRLTSGVASELGLTTDCLVVGGAGDCAAGAVGNGVVEPGVVSTSLGTSGVVFAHSNEPQVDPAGRLHTFCHAVPGCWHMMGVTLSAAGSFDWFAQALCQNEMQQAAAQGGNIFTQLAAEAEAVPAGSDGCLFLPYLSGERAPHADPHARGCFVGLTAGHSRGHLVRAILEGVTYSLRECLDIMVELGVPVDSIRATGGGAKSPFWRQLQADVFQRPVSAMASDEGPAMGVAILAAVGAGEYASVAEACGAMVATIDDHQPNPQLSGRYLASLEVYKSLYPALRESFEKIAKLGG